MLTNAIILNLLIIFFYSIPVLCFIALSLKKKYNMSLKNLVQTNVVNVKQHNSSSVELETINKIANICKEIDEIIDHLYDLQFGLNQNLLDKQLQTIYNKLSKELILKRKTLAYLINLKNIIE